MKIVVIGPGAIGCLLSVLLADSGHECRLVDKNKRRAETISRRGLVLESARGTRSATVPVITEPEAGWAPDLVVFCVKSFDTAPAAESAARFVPPNVMALTLQNGLGNIEAIQARLSSARLFAGVTSHGATILGEGRVFHAGAGDTVLGAIEKTDTGTAQEIVEILSSAGIITRTTGFLLETLWSKLIINSAIGPVTALSGLSNGEVLKHAVWRDMLRKAAIESMDTALRTGINPDYADAVAAVEKVCAGTADNLSSMLQDMKAGRRTEIDAVNGMIARRAREHGFDAPVNEYLIKQIQEK